MNIQLGNLAIEEVVNPDALEKIKVFLNDNGYKRIDRCVDIENEVGNFHIFDIPRLITICGKEKMQEFISFLRDNDLISSGFKERIGLTYLDPRVLTTLTKEEKIV